MTDAELVVMIQEMFGDKVQFSEFMVRGSRVDILLEFQIATPHGPDVLRLLAHNLERQLQ